MLPGLVDVFEEDPVAEAPALGALAVRFRHDVFPAHVVGHGEGLEHFQDVGQFRCQLPVRCRLRLAGTARSCTSPRRTRSWNPTSNSRYGRSSPRALSRSSCVSRRQARKSATSLAASRTRPSMIIIWIPNDLRSQQQDSLPPNRHFRPRQFVCTPEGTKSYPFPGDH